MHEWMRAALSSSEFTVTVIVAAFLFGLVGAVSSCCAPAAVGAIVGYSASAKDSGRRETCMAGAFFLLGTFLAVVALGAVAGFIGKVSGAALGRYWQGIGGLVTVLFGLFVLDWVPLQLPKVSPPYRALPKDMLGAAFFGLVVGGASTACTATCNPLILLPLGLAALQGKMLWGAVLLGAFALGYSLPFAALLMGLRTGLGKMTMLSARVSALVRTVAGFVLLGVGFYMLLTL